MAQRCTARSSQTGEPCRAWAIRGGSVCVAHGGAAPRVRAKAAERLQAAEAWKAVSALMAERPAHRQPVGDRAAEILLAEHAA